MTHSKTPWTAGMDREGRAVIRNCDGNVVAYIPDPALLDHVVETQNAIGPNDPAKLEALIEAAEKTIAELFVIYGDRTTANRLDAALREYRGGK